MGRAPCCDKNGLKRGPWTPEEDQKLIDYIQKNGYGNWRTLPKNAGLQRCGKSCRLRWTNYLRPDIKRGKFSIEDEDTIIHLHSVLGNKWSAIAARLPGRTDNEIKNYWNTRIRKRLLRMGIDPVTHSPRLDLLDFSSMLGNSSRFYNNNSSTSRVFGLQPMVNQDILKLVTSFFSNQPQNHPNSTPIQDLQENKFSSNAQMQNNINTPLLQTNQMQTHIPNTCTTITNTFDTAATTTATTTVANTTYSGARFCAPLCDEAQLMDSYFEQYPTNDLNLDAQNLDQWQSNGLSMLEVLVNVPTSYEYYGSHQNFMDPNLPNNYSTSQSNISGHQSFLSYAPSTMSSSSSSPTHLNSSSNSTTYVNSSGTEDERESYCSDMIKFEYQIL